MIRVNLLSVAGAPAKTRVWIQPDQRGAAWGLLMLLVTGVGVAAWGWHIGRQTVALDALVAQHEAALVRLKAAATLVDQAIARKSELSEKLGLIDRLRSAQKGALTLLTTLSRSLPDGLWLLELKQEGETVQIEGRANSLTAVTDFVERLQDSGVFDRPVEIVSTGTELLDETSVVRFAVRAQALGTASRTAATAAAAATRKGG